MTKDASFHDSKLYRQVYPRQQSKKRDDRSSRRFATTVRLTTFQRGIKMEKSFRNSASGNGALIVSRISTLHEPAYSHPRETTQATEDQGIVCIKSRRERSWSIVDNWKEWSKNHVSKVCICISIDRMCWMIEENRGKGKTTTIKKQWKVEMFCQ